MNNDLIPAMIGVAAQALVENANRLGLTWRLLMATVVDGVNPLAMKATYDGDTASITMFSMCGYFSPGARVYVIQIPPSGNYIVGSTDFTDSLPGATTTIAAGVAGTTTSASYATAPGTPTLEIIKRYGPKSQLLFTHMGTCWVNGAAPSRAQFGVTVDGTTFDLSFQEINVASSHVHVGAQRQLDAPQGEASYTLLWKRGSGTGTITIDAADWASFSVQEVAII